MVFLFTFFSFVFGTIAGSFIDTAAERWGQDTSMMGRSHCVACGYILRWSDLIPLLSFLALRGKCARCTTSIPSRHFFVEFLSGSVFIALFLSSPMAKYIFFLDAKTDVIMLANLIFLWCAASAILIIVLSDARFYIIPDIVSLPSTIFVLLVSFMFTYVIHSQVNATLGMNAPSFLESVLGALVGSAFFFAISFISRGQWMGWGDGKFVLFLGALFGWPFIIPVIFLAFVLGSFVGIVLMARREATMKSLLPFGVFLGISALFFLVFQNTPLGQTFKLFSASFFVW